MRARAILAIGVAALAGAAIVWTPRAGSPEPPGRSARAVEAPPPVVGCRERVEGYRGEVPERARREGVEAGPLLLPYIEGLAEQPAWLYREEPARPRRSLPTARRRPGHYLAHKALVIVALGARVTISGPPDAVAFAYEPGVPRDGLSMRIPGGPSALTFEACPPGQRRFSGPGRLRFTEFAGGIAVAGPRCLPLDIRDEATGRTWRRWLSFGTHGGGCPDA